MKRSLHVTAFGTAFSFTRTEVPMPQPDPGEVLVRNAAAGINHIDLLALRGEMPAGLQPEAPFVAGVEGAGVVQAVGAGVTAVGEGDTVLWFGDLGVGGFGSHVLVRDHQVARLDASADRVQAAALPVAYTTALHMLTNLADVPEGGWVLVHAAGGGVGLALVELAKALGYRVVATEREAKREAVTEAGADVFVDYRTDDLDAAVREATAERGVPLSLNPIGGTSVSTDLARLAPFGTVVLYGFLGGLPTETLADAMVPAFSKSVALRVSDIYTLSNDDPQRFRATLQRVADLAASGQLHPRVRSFGSADEAFEALRRKVHTGKLVLDATAWGAQAAG